MKIFTFRFMWKLVGADTVNFKIVTDTEAGLKQFEEALLKIENLEGVGKEYLHEYDVSKLAVFQNIYKRDSAEVQE